MSSEKPKNSRPPVHAEGKETAGRKDPPTVRKIPSQEQKSQAERNASIARERSLRRTASRKGYAAAKQKSPSSGGIFSEDFNETHKLNRFQESEDDGFPPFLAKSPGESGKNADELVSNIIEQITLKSSGDHTDDSAVQRDLDALISELLYTSAAAAPPGDEEHQGEILTSAIPPKEEAPQGEAPHETEVLETRTVVAVPISPEEDPLAAARMAEIVHQQEKEKKARHTEEMRAAAEEYRQTAERAKAPVRRVERAAKKKWKKEAAAEHLKAKSGRIERFFSSCNFVFFLILLFGIAAGMLVLERPVMSDTENRLLAKMPVFSWESYLSGDYTEDVAAYYNDTVPHRSLFKDLAAAFRQHFGLRQSAVLHGSAPALPSGDNSVSETTLPPVTTVDPAADVTLPATSATEATTAAEPAQEQEGELSNNILITDKRGIMLYGGSFSIGESYAASLNKYQQQLGSDVQVYSMVIPTVCSFYTPENFQYLIASEKDNIQHINDNLQGVKPVDVYGALEKHKDEPIFMRTDHHWSSLGAFYAAELFSAEARVPFVPISEYDKVTKPGYVGTLYSFSQDITLKKNPEDFTYYVPHARFTTTYRNTDLSNPREGKLLINLENVKPVSWYLVYMGTDETVAQIDTEVKNGRTLAILKDSYGNALVPWFTSSFEHIYVIDIRYFQKNAIQYLKDIGATDVLFAMNTFSATGGNCKKIEQIRTQ